MATCAVVAFAGSAGAILFGVVLTHGVYGSRMAWLLGVAIPLMAIAAGFAFAAAKHGLHDGTAEASRPEKAGRAIQNDPRRHMRMFGSVSLLLIAVPMVLIGLLLTTYALLLIAHVFH